MVMEVVLRRFWVLVVGGVRGIGGVGMFVGGEVEVVSEWWDIELKLGWGVWEDRGRLVGLECGLILS